MAMAADGKSLTGVWHGLYSYPAALGPVHFVATLIAVGSMVSGTTHEAAEGWHGAPLKLFADLNGTVAGSSVRLHKQYRAGGAWQHGVDYVGTLSADGTEIEGTWLIPGSWSGRFLMIRGQGASEAVVREAFEPV
jgi:hypothetical protein